MNNASPTDAMLKGHLGSPDFNGTRALFDHLHDLDGSKAEPLDRAVMDDNTSTQRHSDLHENACRLAQHCQRVHAALEKLMTGVIKLPAKRHVPRLSGTNTRTTVLAPLRVCAIAVHRGSVHAPAIVCPHALSFPAP